MKKTFPLTYGKKSDFVTINGVTANNDNKNIDALFILINHTRREKRGK